MKFRKHLGLPAILTCLVLAACARADDYSVLGANVKNYVTGTMDGAYAWYEQGFDPNALTTGLPHAGIVQSAANANWSFRYQPYDQNNVMLLNTNNASGLMTFANPVSANAIAIASSTGVGPALFSPTLHFSDGTPDFIPNIFTEPDWFDTTSPVLTVADGRIQIFPYMAPTPNGAGEFDRVGIAVPTIRIDTFLLPDSLATHPISGITINWSAEKPDAPSPFSSNTAFFGISTSTDGGVTYSAGNLTSSSFNKDVVVEARALQDAAPVPEPAAAICITIPAIALVRRRRRG